MRSNVLFPAWPWRRRWLVVVVVGVVGWCTTLAVAGLPALEIPLLAAATTASVVAVVAQLSEVGGRRGQRRGQGRGQTRRDLGSSAAPASEPDEDGGGLCPPDSRRG